MRRIVAMIADTHGGHKLALCNPATRWEDEDAEGNRTWSGPTLTRTQEWLWSRYTEHMGQALEFAAGDNVTLIHNGDITWGVKYPEQLVSSRIDVQPTIGYYNLLPWLEQENVKTVRLIHGTPSHEFGMGSSNRSIAAMFNMGFQDKSVASSRHLLADVSGVTFDVAHHGPSAGIRVWTAGNQFRYNLRSIMLADILNGRRPPRVVARAHYHTYQHETVRIQTDQGEVASEILMIPGYCGFSHYTVQATRSAYLMQCGVVCAEIIDGAFSRIVPFTDALDIRTKEDL